MLAAEAIMRPPNRGTDPDSVVTNARARRLGVQTQAEQQADLRSQMRTGDTGDTASRYLDGDAVVDGSLEVHGIFVVKFDDGTNAFAVNTTAGGIADFQNGVPLVFFDGELGNETARIDAATGSITLSQGADFLMYSDAGITAVFGIDGATGNVTFAGALGIANSSVLTVFGHLKHKGTAPSAAVGAALGTGGSVGVAIVGTDQFGTITLTAGTTSLVAGVAATVTFNAARPDTNYVVGLWPADPDTGANLIKYYVGTLATGTWEVKFQTAPSSGVVYVLNYGIVEWTH